MLGEKVVLERMTLWLRLPHPSACLHRLLDIAHLMPSLSLSLSLSPPPPSASHDVFSSGGIWVSVLAASRSSEKSVSGHFHISPPPRPPVSG